ncbi:MAG: hypothetical protein CME21_21330 [Gemmatimonadetes bacterium]|nr:hypothetical protein [Gemmatimonadota bacterium]|tara:strand:+ start:184 stop:654 length:471 start_codon:yes stop_codon:yes gene_type:complete
MGTTTFSGPVKAGPLSHSTGTTADTKANVGSAVLSQSASFTQAAASASVNTDIVLPPNSQIVAITFYVSTAFDTGTTTVDVGWVGPSGVVSATSLVDDDDLAATGYHTATPGTDTTRTANWINSGDTDMMIVMTSSATGNGVAHIVVEYVQSNNLT